MCHAARSRYSQSVSRWAGSRSSESTAARMWCQPGVAFGRADPERRVPHPQSRVAAQLGVRAGTAPVLLEEHPQPFLGRAQVGLGVQRAQHRVVRHARVEGGHEPSERGCAADRLVERSAAWRDCGRARPNCSLFHRARLRLAIPTPCGPDHSQQATTRRWRYGRCRRPVADACRRCGCVLPAAVRCLAPAIAGARFRVHRRRPVAPASANACGRRPRRDHHDHEQDTAEAPQTDHDGQIDAQRQRAGGEYGGALQQLQTGGDHAECAGPVRVG